jgi:hypothetical protein
VVATVTRIFGVHNLGLAEDVVQEAFCRAIEVWKFRGVPENPSAWLMATAKNCALDALRRERAARTYELTAAPSRKRTRDSGFSKKGRTCSIPLFKTYIQALRRFENFFQYCRDAVSSPTITAA